ncbi:hypothetical protein [Ruegeria atlantica]|uniref:Uncharacterized protein n=1 Tax=Ruegeria atlantica TaxID=81569 RepID=A0ABX1WDW7_9RHOB|nr:hypothetical protein [Ruegeria atlantica]NOD31497.1 hypothetical protein [Ruegeria atlantica]
MVITSTGQTASDLVWLRDKLWASLYPVKQVKAAPGVTHVLQQSSGAVYTDRPGAWTYDLSQARMFLPEAAPILGGSVVSFERAREAIVQIYEANLREQEDALEKDRNCNYG